MNFHRPVQFKQQLTVSKAHRLPVFRVAAPKLFYSLLLAHDNVRVLAVLSFARERFQSVIGASLNQRRVSDESHAFKLSFTVAIAVELSAIARAIQPVIFDEAAQGNCMNGAGFEKG